ncbi:MAG: hypothetical protein ACTTGJ_00040 [Clostridium sp.]
MTYLTNNLTNNNKFKPINLKKDNTNNKFNNNKMRIGSNLNYFLFTLNI